jgi:23S rRNA (guanosine2251-2'-O)-methyltransferase
LAIVTDYAFRACTNPACRLRYPVASDDVRGRDCPRCGAAAEVVAHAAAQRERRASTPPTSAERPQVEVLVDNVRSLYNVGSIFRTADGAGIRCLHLCGITPTPENPKLAKTALGAQEAVAWRYWPNALEAAQALRAEGAYLMALERTPAALSLQSVQPAAKRLLIVGNEVAGVDPGLLELADSCIAIPMAGRKHSLNVASAFGIAAYVVAGWI